jgi:hypothetical protein
MHSERSFDDPTYFALFPHGFYPRRVSSRGFPHVHALATMKEFESSEKLELFIQTKKEERATEHAQRVVVGENKYVRS